MNWPLPFAQRQVKIRFKTKHNNHYNRHHDHHKFTMSHELADSKGVLALWGRP